MNNIKQLDNSLKELNDKLSNKALFLDASEYDVNKTLYIVYDNEILMTDNLTLDLNIGFFDFYSNESKENVISLLNIINDFISKG